MAEQSGDAGHPESPSGPAQQGQLDIHIHTGKSAVRRTAGTARSLSHESVTSVTAPTKEGAFFFNLRNIKSDIFKI